MNSEMSEWRDLMQDTAVLPAHIMYLLACSETTYSTDTLILDNTIQQNIGGPISCSLSCLYFYCGSLLENVYRL